MLKGKIYKNLEWCEVKIISITPVPNLKLMLGNVLKQENEIHVIYIDENGELDLFKTNSLSHIKII